MLYNRIKGPVTPFHEDEQGYSFRFFCGDNPIPREHSMPKGSKAGYVCGCVTRIGIENIGDGPYLFFWSNPDSHYAAKERA